MSDLYSHGRRLGICLGHGGREWFEEVRVCLEFFADLQEHQVVRLHRPRQDRDPEKEGEVE